MASKAKKFKFPQRTFAYYKKIGPKAFCDEFLFPAMRREHGTGFSMYHWNININPGALFEADQVKRRIPACGTICCIGGTMSNLINNYHKAEIRAYQLGQLLGLDEVAANALFFRWDKEQRVGGDLVWPTKLRVKFLEAKTALQKERVAEQMVRLAVRTKGKCFEPIS